MPSSFPALKALGALAALVLSLGLLATTSWAALPKDLTNFQDEYPCDNNTVLIVR
jgi:hypothetical protein